LPSPGDIAEIVVVDLQTGEDRVVAETRGWDTQLGAQVQWGGSDNSLFFNDVDTITWRAYGVLMDPATGTKRRLEGTIYMVSPDGRSAVSCSLERTGLTQAGYGVIVPTEHIPINKGATKDDGVYVTDTVSGECRMIASIHDIVESVLEPAKYRKGDFYGFHVKYNPQGDRIMFVLRWVPHDKSERMKPMLITMMSDGSDIQLAIPDDLWARRGHHPNWCPDGEYVMMNLNINGEGLRFIRIRYDGTDLSTMIDDVLGSGHPTLHPDGRHVLTDAYVREPVSYGDGSTPIRLVSLDKHEDMVLARIRTEPDWPGPKNELRVDPHPAWDCSYRYVAFNACPDGTRRLYVADLSEHCGNSVS
jgi:hypothetical protein